MGAGSKPPSFASSIAMLVFVASPFIVPPAAFLGFRHPSRALLDRAGRTLANDERHSSGWMLTEPEHSRNCHTLGVSPAEPGGFPLDQAEVTVCV